MLTSACWPPPSIYSSSSPPPGPDGNAVRLVVYGELLSAAGYMRDRLYLEYAITWDPEVWALQHAGGPQPVEPGVIKVGQAD